jgi:hypothetical protein
MNRFFLLLACGLAIMAGAGCAGTRESSDPDMAPWETVPQGQSGLILTPGTSLLGRVVWVNGPARFAVLRFPIGRVPEAGRRMAVYRLGLKIGEVRISGPQTEDNIVADIIAGEAGMGDDIREE